jgi:Zn finger protein HypA/HybF involved in hydrogenase expression
MAKTQPSIGAIPNTVEKEDSFTCRHCGGLVPTTGESVNSFVPTVGIRRMTHYICPSCGKPSVRPEREKTG